MKLNQKGFSPIEGLLILIIVGIIGFVGYFVYNANQQEPEESTSTIQRAPKNESAGKEAIQKPEVPDLIEYEGDGVVINKPEDVSQLKDASETFKSYIAKEIKDFVKSCDDGQIVVAKIYKDQWAIGSAGGQGCGGARAVWFKENDKWAMHRDLSGQEIPLCSVLKKFDAPKEILNECQDDSKEFDGKELEIIENPN